MRLSFKTCSIFAGKRGPLDYGAAQPCVSSYVPRLPLIFVLALSSPHNSFLHATYPQSVLSLLRVDTFTVPSGTAFLEKVVDEVGEGRPSVRYAM